MPTAYISNDFEAELIACGRIVQDDDDSVPIQEAERRFNLYVELVDSLRGTEGANVACILLRSMQSVHDYGAYQHTMNKLVFDFPSSLVAEAVIAEVPRLVRGFPDWAGEVLNMLVHAQGRSDALVSAFNLELSGLAAEGRDAFVHFIREQEREGWLEHKPGVLAP